MDLGPRRRQRQAATGCAVTWPCGPKKVTERMLQLSDLESGSNGNREVKFLKIHGV